MFDNACMSIYRLMFTVVILLGNQPWDFHVGRHLQ